MVHRSKWRNERSRQNCTGACLDAKGHVWWVWMHCTCSLGSGILFGGTFPEGTFLIHTGQGLASSLQILYVHGNEDGGRCLDIVAEGATMESLVKHWKTSLRRPPFWDTSPLRGCSLDPPPHPPPSMHTQCEVSFIWQTAPTNPPSTPDDGIRIVQLPRRCASLGIPCRTDAHRSPVMPGGLVLFVRSAYPLWRCPDGRN